MKTSETLPFPIPNDRIINRIKLTKIPFKEKDRALWHTFQNMQPKILEERGQTPNTHILCKKCE